MSKRNLKFHQIELSRTFDIRALINAYYFSSKPDFVPHFEKYDFSQIIYVISGHGVYTTDEAAFEFKPGMMFYRPAQQSSKYEWTSADASLAVISFVCPSRAMAHFEGAPITLCEEERETLLDLMKTAARIFEHVKYGGEECGMQLRADVPDVVLHFVFASLERFLSMVYCRLCNIRLLVDEGQKVNRYLDDSSLVKEIQDYLHAHVCEPLTVNDICKHFRFSPASLQKKFRAVTGQSLMAYFSDQKIVRAKHLIRFETVSFTEISEQLGFSSVNYFSKVFKEKVGVSPTEFSRYVSKRRVDDT